MSRQVSPAVKAFIFVAILFSCSANAEQSNFVDLAGQDPDQKCNHPPFTSPPFKNIYEKHTNAIFEVWVTNAIGLERAGTATLIDDSGVFLTAAHVVKDHKQNPIKLKQYQEGRWYEYDAEVIAGSVSVGTRHDTVLLRAKSWQNDHREPYQLRFDEAEREKVYVLGYEDKNTPEMNDLPVHIPLVFMSVNHDNNTVEYKATVFGNASGALIYDEYGRAFEMVLGHKVPRYYTFKDLPPERYREDSAARDTMIAVPLQDTLSVLKACLGPSSYMRKLIVELRSAVNTKLLIELTSKSTPIDIALLIDEEFFGEVGKKWAPQVEENGTLFQATENAAESLCVRKYFFRVMARARANNADDSISPSLETCTDVTDEQPSISSNPPRSPPQKAAAPPPDGAELARRLGAKTPQTIGQLGATFLEQALTTSLSNPELKRANIEIALALLRYGADTPAFHRALETGTNERNYAAVAGNLALAESIGAKYEISSSAAAREAILAADLLGGSPTAYQLAAQYALQEYDQIAAAGLYARAYRLLTGSIPDEQVFRNDLEQKFKAIAAKDPVIANADIMSFMVTPTSSPPATRWYALAAYEKRQFTFRGLTVGAVAIASGPAAHDAYDRRITIVNHTHESIVGLYASNTGKYAYDFDLLGDDTVGPQRQFTVDLDDSSGYCTFDLRVVLKDGSIAEKYNFNVCTASSWDIYD